MWICKQIYKAHTWWICKQIYKMWWIYRSTDHRYTALKLRIDHQMRNTVRDHQSILKQFIWYRDCQLWITDRNYNYRHSGQLRDTQFISNRDYQMRNRGRDPGVLHKIQANIQDILDLQLNLQDLSDLQHDLQPDLHWQWPIQWQIQWTLSLMLISDLTFEH